ncbi:MAG: response regulator [Rickettsiales bacterium]
MTNNATPNPAGRPFTLLLAEDNVGDAMIVRHALKSSEADYALHIVHDGLEALEFLHKQYPFADAPTPDLILMDINMPRMGGKECLRAIKQDPALKTLPVAMLTSSDAPDDIRECYMAGANCYLLKQFDVGAFREMLKDAVGFWSRVARVA